MKKVIFVGSTAYSGSTFLDMTLGNDPKGFSIGEAIALFEPVKRHHYAPICGCHNKACRVWSELRKHPPAELYRSIFDKHPEVEFIVDSSKDPLWINDRIRDLKKQGIDYQIALIWKSPLEIAHSFYKRGEYQRWVRSWVNYHRLLYTLQPDNWTTVNYREYTSHPESLRNFCESLGIPYFEGKERFWEKSHHLLFGNHSARKHLLRSHQDNQRDGAYEDFQKITYKPVTDPELRFRVGMDMQSNPMIADLQRFLESHASGEEMDEVTLESIQMGFTEVKLRQFKRRMRRVKGKTLAPKNNTVRTPLSIAESTAAR